MVIRAGDRVAAVIARDERLIDVFVAASPTFDRLRSPTMRKVMARLVTVAQAARMAGLDPAELVARLEAALAEPGGAAGAANGTNPDEAASPGTAAATDATASLPAHLAALPPEQILDLDVRPELRRGEEPFSKIMAARRALPPGGALRLRATFEPVPLYSVLGRQGLCHWTERLAGDDWCIWFYLEEGASPAAAATSAPGAADEAVDDGAVVLDVRGLEPPEPMQRTLEALETLPEGATLVQLNVREPRFLFPLLTERGWSFEVRRQGDQLVRTFIHRAAAQ